MMRKQEAKQKIEITAPNFQTAEFHIVGTVPYMQNKFSAKAKEKMKETQEGGAKSKNKKVREAKNFEEIYQGAMYISNEGWNGMPATAFRNAMITACKLVGVVMTRAKLAVFVEADGFDVEDATPLIRITKGTPRRCDMPVRLETGVCDIHPRPVWNPGWEATVRIRFDADMFDTKDIANLLMRAGLQVGIGEGRNDSKKSNGIGYGMFTIIGGEN